MTKKIPAMLLFSLMLAACGGGGDNNSGVEDNNPSPNPGSSPQNPGQDQVNINPGFSGALFIDNENQYMDIESGHYFALAPSDTEHLISPSKDGSEYVETIARFRNLPGALTGWNEAIVIRDMQTGFTKDSFELRESVVGPAKLSPNNEFVAAVWRNEAIDEDFDEDKLTIFSRSGEVISRSSVENIYRFDWLADGRLVFASIKDRSIYLTNAPHTTEATVLKSFSEAEGYPGWVKVSPDNTQITFELVSEFAPSPFSSWRRANVWSMNLDGSGLKQVARGERDEPLINTPVWSPDNSWIAMLEGASSNISFVPDPIDTDAEIVVGRGVAGVLFAVSASGENELLPANTELVKPLFELTSENKKRFLRTRYESDMQWLDKIAVPAQNAGTLPEVNQLPHRGIEGSLYFDNDNSIPGVDTSNLDIFNLTDSSINTQFSLTNDDLDHVNDLVYVSENKEWVAHYYDDVQNPALNVYSMMGELQYSFPLEAPDGTDLTPTNRIQFSPTNPDLILFTYRFLDQDWFRRAVVINWRTKEVVKVFFDNNYYGSEWTRDGHILLTARDNGEVYQSNIEGQTFSDPSLLFTLTDPVKDIALNPAGDRLALDIVGSIWTSNMQGADLKRVTARSSEYFAGPEWSPDGKYLAFKSISSDDNVTDLGDLWITAADAENVIVRYPFNSPHAIPVLDSNGSQFDFFGTFSWR